MEQSFRPMRRFKQAISEEECRKRGNERAGGSIKSQVRNTIKHDGIDQSDVNLRFEGERTKYALLPVWLLVTNWKGDRYVFAMNGQTGKLIGDLPVDRGRFWLSAFLGANAIALIVFLLSILL